MSKITEHDVKELLHREAVHIHEINPNARHVLVVDRCKLTASDVNALGKYWIKLTGNSPIVLRTDKAGGLVIYEIGATTKMNQGG